MSSYCQCSIEHQDSLFGPSGQISGSRNRGSQVIVDFFEDVLQGGRKRNTVIHGETETMSLSRTVIRILSDDNDFYFIVRAKIKSCLLYTSPSPRDTR